MNKHSCKLTAEQIKSIIIEYNSGMASTKLALKYLVDKSTILRLLRRYNITRRDKSTARREIDECIFKS